MKIAQIIEGDKEVYIKIGTIGGNLAKSVKKAYLNCGDADVGCIDYLQNPKDNSIVDVCVRIESNRKDLIHLWNLDENLPNEKSDLVTQSISRSELVDKISNY